MKAEIPLAVAVFFFLLALYSAGAVEITEFNASALEAGEGEAIDFWAEVDEQGERGLVFEWDFGDGTIAATTERKSSHSYLDDGEFTVSFKVKKGKETLDEESLKVKIKMSDFEPVLLFPKPVPKMSGDVTLARKGAAHTIQFFFRGPNNQDLQEGRDLKVLVVSVSGKEIRVEADEQVEYAYSGSFSSDYSFGSIEKIEIEAELGGLGRKRFSFPAFFRPAEIRAGNPFPLGDEFRENDRVGRIELDLNLEGERIEGTGEFSAVLYFAEGFEEQDLTYSAGKWSTGFEHIVSMLDLVEGIELLVSGEDAHGNRLERSFAVPLSGPETVFEVELVKPFSGSRGELVFGREVEFVAEVGPKESLQHLENVRVWIESWDGRRVELVGEGKSYKAAIKMPDGGEGELIMGLFGEADFYGRKQSYSRDLNVGLVREAKAEDWLSVIALGFAVLFAVLAVAGLFFWRKSRAKDLVVQEGRLVEIGRGEKQAKLEYFKRKLTDEQYREKVLKLKQEREQILKKIGKKGKKR